MTRPSRAAILLVVAALLCLSSCGQKPLHNFTRHGSVDLTGAVTVQGTFSTTDLSDSQASDPRGCEASIHATPYVIGFQPPITIDGRQFTLELTVPKTQTRVGTHTGYTIVGVSGDSYADPSSAITFRADGGGSVAVRDALQVGATPGGPVVTGTVRWSCRDGTVGS